MDLKKIIIKINFVAIWNLFKKHVLRQKPMINFGLKRDKVDKKDYKFKVRTPITSLPDEYGHDMAIKMPVRTNQLTIGSCVAHAVLHAFYIARVTNGMIIELLSRLFLYFNLRTDKANDTGGSIREGIKAMNVFGAPHETTWPYNVNRFAEMPPENAFKEGEEHQAVLYERIYPVTREAIMDAIFRGYGVVYGKALHKSFMTDEVASTGIIPIPKCKCKDPIVGYHAMTIYGYTQEYTLEFNSWGDDWGINGTCQIPWEIVLNSKEAFDFWAITLTE